MKPVALFTARVFTHLGLPRFVVLQTQTLAKSTGTGESMLPTDQKAHHGLEIMVRMSHTDCIGPAVW